MSNTLLLLFLLFLAVSFGSSIVYIIKKILKKETVTGYISVSAAGLSALCLALSFGKNDLPACFMLFGLSFASAAVILIFAIAICKIMRKDTKKYRIRLAVVSVLCVASFVSSFYAVNTSLDDPEKYEVVIKTDYDFDVKDGDTPIQVVKSSGFQHSEIYQSKYHRVFDFSDNCLLFEKTDATAEDCISAVMGNAYLDAKYKEFFTDFIRRIDKKYPNADFSILYHNLGTLKVVVLDKLDYWMKSLSSDSYGCYKIDENVIYIPAGTEYVEGEWGYQVLIHEFCHVVRTARWTENEGQLINYASFNGSGSDMQLLMEAMNSVFSCSLLNYEEKDIAYQVPSNYLRIMLDCMDNYSLEDYINHGDTYFLKKLDEYTGYTNYAEVIWKLITVQRSDYQDDRMEISAEKYYPIYRYLCDMYYDKYITDEMTDEEQRQVVGDLVEKAFFDAPGEYTISPEFFYTYLEEYINK